MGRCGPHPRSLDYELCPDQHYRKIGEILTDQGWNEAYIRAAESHGYGICTDVEPRSRLEQSLYAIDELTGLVSACALVRPSKSVKDMKGKSVRKKWKDASSAAGADRDIISKGAAMLGEDLDDLRSDVIMGMREVADDIGL